MATKAAGIVQPNARGDFISYNGLAKIDHTEQTGQHIFRINIPQEASDDQTPTGKILFTFNLQPYYLGEAAKAFAEMYEYYSLENVVLHAQSTAPFGVSSGGIQICHITDPDNAVFYTAGTNLKLNLAKVVRQQDSVLLRPRESVELAVKTNGELFTNFSLGKTQRFSSFGYIVACMRDTPATGDSISFAFTLSGIIKGSRTCISKAVTTPAQSMDEMSRMLMADRIFDNVNIHVAITCDPEMQKFMIYSKSRGLTDFILKPRGNSFDGDLDFSQGLAMVNRHVAEIIFGIEPEDGPEEVNKILKFTTNIVGSIILK